MIVVGNHNRWQLILDSVNTHHEQTEEDPLPLNIIITMKDLRKLASNMYASITTIDDEGITLMRQHIPDMYSKHTYDRGKRVSQIEREQKSITDVSYAYGELDHEVFATIYAKLQGSYGISKDAFVDLGSGVGKIVYTAGFVGKFKKCIGIEQIKCLHDRGQKRERLWKKIANKYISLNEIQYRFCDNDFMTILNEWTKTATLILLHWTAFSSPQILKISLQGLKECQEGCMCITLTHSIPVIAETGFEIIENGFCETSWGEASYFIHEKMS